MNLLFVTFEADQLDLLLADKSVSNSSGLPLGSRATLDVRDVPRCSSVFN